MISQLEKYLEHKDIVMRELAARVGDLARKNYELEWTTISLCRRTHTLADRVGGREDRRHMPYLRARGYGNVMQRQRGRRTGERARPERPAVEDGDVALSDYRSDSE